MAKESVEITQMFETAVAMLMRLECENAADEIEGTASYKFLIQTLMDINNAAGRKGADIADIAPKGLQYVLNLMIKTDCEQLTTKVLIQIVPSANYIGQLTNPAKVPFSHTSAL